MLSWSRFGCSVAMVLGLVGVGCSDEDPAPADEAGVMPLAPDAEVPSGLDSGVVDAGEPIRDAKTGEDAAPPPPAPAELGEACRAVACRAGLVCHEELCIEPPRARFCHCVQGASTGSPRDVVLTLDEIELPPVRTGQCSACVELKPGHRYKLQRELWPSGERVIGLELPAARAGDNLIALSTKYQVVMLPCGSVVKGLGL